jgi:undecaprenyl-diphosphatase
MNILHVITLGVIEGITEFLPISSTFHLIFASSLLGIKQDDFVKLFEVFIQSGAILSVVLLYAQDVVKDKRLAVNVLVSFIPTAVIGLALHSFIKNVLFSSLLLMLTVFVCIGIVFIITELLVKKGFIKQLKSVESLNYKEAIIIGLCQSLAIIPGVSRAGSVILAMMFLHYKRTDAARYSFLLSIPTIFAASVLDALKMRHLLLSSSTNIGYLILGFIGWRFGLVFGLM